MTVRPVHEVLQDRLAAYLGPHTARTALRTFAEKAVGRAPEALTARDVPPVLDALRPMLRTLLGAAPGEALLARIREELT